MIEERSILAVADSVMDIDTLLRYSKITIKIKGAPLIRKFIPLSPKANWKSKFIIA